MASYNEQMPADCGPTPDRWSNVSGSICSVRLSAVRAMSSAREFVEELETADEVYV
jgi:hypothetical protein